MNKTLCLLAAAAIGLSACSAERVSNFPSYKLDVVQGNELDARAVASLYGGMSRDQVQLMLGTPLLRDPFHADRWDYTYNISRNGVAKDIRVLTLHFENNTLVRAEGNAIEYAKQQLEAQYGKAPEAEPTPAP